MTNISPQTIRDLDQSATTGDKASDLSEVKNRSGVYVFEADKISRLRRFLCLGSSGNTYYVEAKTLANDAIKNIDDLIKEDGQAVVRELVEFSTGGRAAKEDNILFTLAACARTGDEATRRAAYQAVQKICRTFSSFSKFVGYCQEMLPNSSGWGKFMRMTTQAWYLGKDERTIAYQMTKYPNRNGFSHKDMLFLGHVKPDTDVRQMVFKYGAKGFEALMESIEGDAVAKQKVIKSHDALILLDAVNQLKATRDPKEAAAIIAQYELVHEHVPTEIKDAPEVWEALLNNMPVGAMVRSLGKMTSYGLLGKDTASAKKVIAELANTDQIKRARIHPYNVLNALRTYARGEGTRLTWAPNPQITDALNDLFYESFKYAQPSGKRIMVAVDISGSMDSAFVWQGQRDKKGTMMFNQAMTARTAAAAMAMATVRVEKDYEMVCFAGGLSSLNVNPAMRLDKVEGEMVRVSSHMSGTDISLPFRYATEKKKHFDGFVVFTDTETNLFNQDKPVVALRKYREKVNPDARLIVVAFSKDKFTIADPTDRGMLDMPGFDSNAPAIVSDFVAGRI